MAHGLVDVMLLYNVGAVSALIYAGTGLELSGIGLWSGCGPSRGDGRLVHCVPSEQAGERERRKVANQTDQAPKGQNGENHTHTKTPDETFVH